MTDRTSIAAERTAIEAGLGVLMRVVTSEPRSFTMARHGGLVSVVKHGVEVENNTLSVWVWSRWRFYEHATCMYRGHNQLCDIRRADDCMATVSACIA